MKERALIRILRFAMVPFRIKLHFPCCVLFGLSLTGLQICFLRQIADQHRANGVTIAPVIVNFMVRTPVSSSLAPSMAQEEDKRSLEAQFAAAVKVIWSLPEEGPFQPSDDMMLMFYSYYKQATAGPCNIPRPLGFWDSRGKAKWDAWNSLGNMTKEEAMMNYVEDIQLILETIPVSDEVSDLVQKLGNFYMEVDGDGQECDENETDKRPFTRPFAKEADELLSPLKKPAMEGYGDLWEDIQNLQGKDSECHGVSVSSEEAAEGSKDSCEVERRAGGSDWRQSEEDESGDEEDNEEDGDKVEEKEWSPDPRLLMVEDRRWRSDTRGSNSSVEPSMSSFTNGTHSSLNSEVEEEELACSIETSTENSMCLTFNGHLSNQRDNVFERNFRSTDSDNEEFCDSMEHPATEEVGSRAASVRHRDLLFESNTTNGEKDHALTGDTCLKGMITTTHHNSSLSRGGRGSQSPKSACSPQLCARVDAAYCCVSHSARNSMASRGSIDEQIATALLRLQHDMTDVLHKLHTLEVLTVSQSRSSSPKQEEPLPAARKFLRPSWWPFDHSPFTVVMTALWPLIAYWLVQLYSQRKRRKIT